jgi:uncharacterized damage-inducible protein DinB
MDPGREAVVEALRQIIEGTDIPPPRTLLNMTAKRAAVRLPEMPYSISTNLAHANFWQEIWLERLAGKRARSFPEDWKTPPAEEWPSIREQFLSGLDRAVEIARSEPFDHKMKSDTVAIKTLLQIVVHDAYHIGQINLLKRALSGGS